MIKKLGHRGVILKGEKAPYQNTLHAFEIALKDMDGFECDAVCSQDEDVFLIHHTKSVYGHVTNALAEHLDEKSMKLVGNRRLEQLRTEEVKLLRLKTGEKIPTLKETLNLFKDKPDKILNLELKGDSVYKHALPLILYAIEARIIQQKQVIISSFNHEDLIEVRKFSPNIQIGMLFMSEKENEHLMYPWSTNSKSTYKPLLKKYLSDEKALKIKPDYIIIPDGAFTTKNLQMIQKECPKAKVISWVYTERGDYDAQNFYATLNKHKQQIAAIITDTP